MTDLQNYLVLDTETNDFTNNGGQAIQIGWCVVQGRKVVDSGHVNMRPPPGLVMSESAQKTHGLSLDYLHQHGEDGAETLRDVVDERLLWFVRELGYAVLGHNLQFDIEAISNACAAHGVSAPGWAGFELIDTSMLVKADRLRSDWAHVANQPIYRVHPETTVEFFKRIRGMWVKGLKYNLDLSLERYGIDLARQAHNAEEDCIATHLVFEALRDRNALQELLWPEGVS